MIKLKILTEYFQRLYAAPLERQFNLHNAYFKTSVLVRPQEI